VRRLAPTLIGGPALGAVALTLAGLPGALFPPWPASWPDQSLSVTAREMSELRALRAQRKFPADARLFDAGAGGERDRGSAAARVNGVPDNLVRDLQAHPAKSYGLGRAKELRAAFPRRDSADQDRVLGYVEQTPAIVRIASSDERLNVWRFRIPYGRFVRRT
jgi:hypothetical protein